jgi:hypothetical protein
MNLSYLVLGGTFPKGIFEGDAKDILTPGHEPV